MEYRGSAFFLYATEELAQFAVKTLNYKPPNPSAKKLFVKPSRQPISVKTSRRHHLVGQPRTGEAIFETTHHGHWV